MRLGQAGWVVQRVGEMRIERKGGFRFMRGIISRKLMKDCY